MTGAAAKARTGGSIRLALRLVCLLAAMLGAYGVTAQQRAGDATAILMHVDGAISPASADYILRGLEDAAERGAALVVLRLDTPGGLDTSMREIIRAILASDVPVATWVSPSGARAASAGTYILYASHVAAMAPATNLGAATPVALGGGGGNPFGEPAEEEDGEEPATPSPANAGEAKAVNDAVAYIRGLAELRDRNADWAERAVREAVSLSASAALAEDVVDFIAADIDALLAKADGMRISLARGEVVLATADLPVEVVEPDWRTALLSVITNPNVALILMMIGIYGLIFEFLNPGMLVSGTVGGISLVLGLYALALLPLNYAGILLIVLGLALIVAEAFAPSFGVLGIGGTLALILGAVILVDTDVPGIEVSIPLVAGVGVAGLAFTMLAARMAARSFRAPVVSGVEELIGAKAEVLGWSGTSGHVWTHGERWKAAGPEGLQPDETVRVSALNGLVLTVERVPGKDGGPA